LVNVFFIEKKLLISLKFVVRNFSFWRNLRAELTFRAPVFPMSEIRIWLSKKCLILLTFSTHDAADTHCMSAIVCRVWDVDWACVSTQRSSKPFQRRPRSPAGQNVRYV